MTISSDIATLAVDWGTSQLRLWPIDRAGNIVTKIQTSDGADGLSREQFAPLFKSHLTNLGLRPDVPAVICGMAGSRQGWHEAPYVSLPSALWTLADQCARFVADDRSVLIVPGVARRDANAPDVMRSEETQLLGLTTMGCASAVVCMPGTHTKWATLSNSTLTEYGTAMVGEVFRMMTDHSILRHTVSMGKPDIQSEAFRAGVRRAFNAPSNILSDLFSIRASGLLLGTSPADAASMLSGLLVGCDIGNHASLISNQAQIELVGGNPLGDAYANGFEETGMKVRQWDGDELAVAGLVAIARQQWPDRFDIGNPQIRERYA